MRGTIAARFEAKVDKTGECWEWTGSRNPLDYGQMRIGTPGTHGRLVKAHRLAWELAHGPIPPGMCVLHQCDNPPCVRPEHLWMGTMAQNSQDMHDKGRWHRERREWRKHVPRGSETSLAKVTEVDVLTIRGRVGAGETRRAVAADYAISEQQVGMIVARRSWAHVE